MAKAKEPPSPTDESRASGKKPSILVINEADVLFRVGKKKRPEQSPFDGWTPLTLAAYHGDEPQLAKLIGKFTNLEQENAPGVTPLIASAMGGHANVALMLLQRGANPRHVVGLFEDTALMAAAFRGAVDVARLLLAYAPDLLNRANVNGYTPLMAAAIEGHEPMVRMLIARGANVQLKTAAGSGLTRTIGLEDDSPSLPYVTSEPFPHLRRSVSSTAYRLINSDRQELTAVALASKCGHEHIVSLFRRAELSSLEEGIEKSEDIFYSELASNKEFVNDATSIANAQTQFFTAIGIRDKRARGLVADVIKAALDQDTARLQRVREALGKKEAPSTLASRQTLELPEAIPEEARYQPRQGVVEFLEKGWPAPYIKASALSQPDLRRLDRAAYTALHNWLRKNQLPEHLHLPTRSQLADDEVQHLDPERARHAQRILRAYERRSTGQNK